MLLLKLLTAHLLGDYLFQSTHVATQKHRAGILAVHAIVHAVLLGLVGLSEPASARLWWVLLGVLAAHASIDAWTSRFKTRNWKQLLVDQSLHLLAIAGAVALVQPSELETLAEGWQAAGRQSGPYAVLAGFTAAVWAGAVMVERWVEPFAAQLGEKRPGLARAGRMIGLFERAIIFIAMVLRIEALVGFVVAAKAILRLPEAREAGHRELAEYYLVGSLASVFWAVLLGVLTRWAVTGNP